MAAGAARLRAAAAQRTQKKLVRRETKPWRVKKDHKLETDLRQFPDVLAPTALDDEIPAPAIETLLASVEERYPIVHEYYRLKAHALGLADFATYDLLAPYSASERRVAFPDAQRLVLESFAQVAPPLADAARAFFDERRIDAEPRP